MHYKRTPNIRNLKTTRKHLLLRNLRKKNTSPKPILINPNMNAKTLTKTSMRMSQNTAIGMVMVTKNLTVTTKGTKSSPMEVTERKDMVVGTKDTCLNNRTRRDTNKKDTATTNKVMNMSNHLMAINDHPTDTIRKVTATKRKITDISNHLMEDTSKRGMAIKTKTTMTTKTMDTKNNLTEDTRKRITDMSKKSMVITIKSTDTSKRVTEGTKRAVVM